jgi:hypothetical protein
MPDNTTLPFGFPAIGHKKLTAAFDGGRLTSHGGMAIRGEDLVHVWPLQRRHITPNGVYFANRTLPAFVLPEPVEA